MFQQLNPARILLILGLFALAIVACSDSDPSTPDATATPMSNATNTPEPQPTDVPDPTAVPTDVPQPEQSGAIDWEPQIIYSSPSRARR